MKQACIFIDFINEIVHPDGKLSGKGYTDFISEFDTLTHVQQELHAARIRGDMIIHVRLGFSESYIDQPKNSPLFGKAHEYTALQENTWATEFHESIKIEPTDTIITKRRVSAFYGTELDLLLRNNNITHVRIAGVATDLAVATTAREAHDRDYKVSIPFQACAAAIFEDHVNALGLLEKIATIDGIKVTTEEARV